MKASVPRRKFAAIVGPAGRLAALSARVNTSSIDTHLRLAIHPSRTPYSRDEFPTHDTRHSIHKEDKSIKLSVVNPTARETITQLVDGLRATSVTTHPHEILGLLSYGLSRHGMTPTAGVLGAALTWKDQVALVDDQGPITYSELGWLTMRLASGFEAGHWVRPGHPVALMANDDRYLIVALAAACMVGGEVSMLNPRMGTDELGDYLATEKIETLIGTEVEGFHGLHIGLDDLRGLIDAARTPIESKAHRSRLVMLTGGTTGAPKGIPIHRRLTAPLAAFALAGGTQVRPGTPALICVPLYHGYGLALVMLCMAAGAPAILTSHLRAAEISTMAKGVTVPRLDWGKAIYQAIEEQGVGSVFAAPAHLRSLAAYLEGANIRPQDMPVTNIVSGTDRLDPQTVASLCDLFGPVVTSYYGTTETGTVTMIKGEDLAERPTSVGRPVVGSKIAIVDDAGDVVPRGVPGHVRLWSPLSSLSDSPGERGYTTSDRGLVDEEGYLYHLGRSDVRQRLGGEFVNLARVEEVLASADGVVSARAWVEDHPDETHALPSRVAAHVDVTGRSPITEDSLRGLVRTRLGPAAQPVRISINVIATLT